MKHNQHIDDFINQKPPLFIRIGTTIITLLLIALAIALCYALHSKCM